MILPLCALAPCSRQGDLRDESRGDDPPDGVTVVGRRAVLEPHSIHLLEVLRHAFVPAPLMARLHHLSRAVP